MWCQLLIFLWVILYDDIYLLMLFRLFSLCFAFEDDWVPQGSSSDWKKKKKSVVGKPHGHIATLSQWLKQVWKPGGCMNLSMKRFGSSGPCPDLPVREPRGTFVPGQDSQSLWATAAGQGEPCGDAASWQLLAPPRCFQRSDPSTCSWRLARTLELGPHPALVIV